MITSKQDINTSNSGMRIAKTHKEDIKVTRTRSNIATATGLVIAFGFSQIGGAKQAEAQETAIYAGAGMGLAALCVTNPLLCAGGAVIGTGALVYSTIPEESNVVNLDSYRKAPPKDKGYYCRGFSRFGEVIEDFGLNGKTAFISDHIYAQSVVDACHEFNTDHMIAEPGSIIASSCGRSVLGIGSVINQIPCVVAEEYNDFP